MLIMMGTCVYAEDQEVEVEIPSFDVFLNGTLYPSDHAKYPMIVYKNITYFPMTWHLSRHLGLSTSYSSESGLKIDSGFQSADWVKIQSGEDNEGYLKAYMPYYNIYINKTEINNQNEPYPILNFRGITYFPLTWRFASDMFGWDYKYDSEDGLFIYSSESIDRFFITEYYEEVMVKEYIEGSKAYTPGQFFYVYDEKDHQNRLLSHGRSPLLGSDYFTDQITDYPIYRAPINYDPSIDYSESIFILQGGSGISSRVYGDYSVEDQLVYFLTDPLSNGGNSSDHEGLIANYINEETFQINLKTTLDSSLSHLTEILIQNVILDNTNAETISHYIVNKVKNDFYNVDSDTLEEVIIDTYTEMYIDGYFVVIRTIGSDNGPYINIIIQ